MAITYSRGDIWLADLGISVGSEQAGTRPVLIIQNDVGNRFSTTVIVASITSSERRKNDMPTHVLVSRNECMLNADSVILLEQIRTIDKTRMKSYIASLTPATMREVDEKIGISVNV